MTIVQIEGTTHILSLFLFQTQTTGALSKAIGGFDLVELEFHTLFLRIARCAHVIVSFLSGAKHSITPIKALGCLEFFLSFSCRGFGYS